MPEREFYPFLVSACLAGINCRYDGSNNYDPLIAALLESGLALAVCPEQLGGLPTPRPAAEIRQGRVLTAQGRDLTAAFVTGAEQVARLAKAHGCVIAVLKAKSPSCGVDQIYDGSFKRRLIFGRGICAQRLAELGLWLYTERTLFFRESSSLKNRP